MENNIPTVPPMKNSEDENNVKSKNNKLKIIIPIIAAVVIISAIVTIILLKGKKSADPIVITDANGVPYTDVDGTPITVITETEVINITDANGEEVTDTKGKTLTTVVYKNIEITVPVTDKKGNKVTDKNGEVVYTEQEISVPYETETTSKVVGTSIEAITDGQGNTGVDASGNILTTIIPITEGTTAYIEPANTEWKFTQGGSAVDYISDIILTSDNCYITANVSNSKDGDFKDFEDSGLLAPYTVLTKTDNDGKTVWQKAAGTKKGTFQIMALAANSDGSFYAAGYGKNVEDAQGYGYYDAFVAKYSKSGELKWIKKFGTSTVDYFNDVIITKDGGVVAVGSVGNNNKDAAGFGGKQLESRASIVKFTKDGEIEWKNIVGGNQDYFNGVTEGKDGNLYAVGNLYSGTLFKTVGNSDSGIVKFSSDGTYKDVLPIAGKDIENFKSIITSSDGNLVTVGYSKSADTDEDNSFFKGDYAARGNYDAYIIKVSTDLKIVSASAFRGQYDDKLENLLELPNGTFVAVGYTNSSTRDLKGVTTRGGTDIVLACFNKNCDLLWARSFGGTEDDSASTICAGADGGYVVAGKTCSKDVDLQNISKYASSTASVGVAVKFPE